MGGCTVALSEATVRVYLDLIAFERELKQRVSKAANEIGRDFDRDMRRDMGATGRSAGLDFRDGIRTSMGRAGAQSATEFGTTFRSELPKSIGDAGNQLGRQLRVSVGRAGTDAGARFCQNLRRIMAQCGRTSGREFMTALREGMFASKSATSNFGNQITNEVTPAARKAGSSASKEFNLSFGLGSARVGGPVLAAFAILGSEIATQVGPALSIIAGFPPLLTAAAVSVGILITAFRGVGDAIKAAAGGDLDALNKAMAKLSPTARGVVQEFRQMVPAFDRLRRQVQDAFFGQLTGEMTAVGRAMTVDLKQGILETSQSLGRLSHAFVQTFTEARGVANLDRVFRGTSDFFDQLSVGVRNLMRGFLDFSGSAAPGLNALGRALNDLLTNWGNFLTRSANSGQALVWIESGIQGMRQLASTVSDIVSVFGTLLAAARPLALLMSGVFHVVTDLVQAFGQLPGPIQTAALAALLFARSGLPQFIKKATAETGPLAKATKEVSKSYDAGNAAARRFANTVTTNVGNAITAVTTGTARLSSTVGTGMMRAVSAVDAATVGLASSLRGGFVRANDLAAAATERTAAAIYDNFGRASVQAQTALNRIQLETQGATRAFRSGLLPAAQEIDSAVTRAGAALTFFGNNVREQVIRTALAARTAVAQAAVGVGTGFVHSVQAAGTAAVSFGNSVQSGVVRSAQAARSALSSVSTALANTVLRPLVQAREAYLTTTNSVRTFAQVHTDMTNRLGQSSTVLTRIRDTFTNMGASAAGTGAALRTAFNGPITAIQNLGSAAVGAGNALVSGLTRAAGGLVSALGGPWGVALAAAGVALALFASRQQEAAQRSAEYKAAVDSIQGTLNKVTGAVTQYTREQAAADPAVKKAIEAFKNYGVSARTVVDAAIGIKGANDTVTSSVQGTIRELANQKVAWLDSKGGGDNFRKGLQELGLSQEQFVNALAQGGPVLADIQAKTNALSSSDDNMSKVKGAALDAIIRETGALRGGLGSYQDYAAKVQAAADAQRKQAEAAGLTVPGLQALSGAVDTLSSDMSSAEQKAKALTVAMRILSGDSLSLEQAVAQSRDLVDQMAQSFKDGATQAQAHGQALIDDTGMINTNLAAGRDLLNQTSSYQEALASVIQQTYEKARAQGVSEADAAKLATDAGNNLVKSYRDQAIAAGAVPEKVDAIINRYGLIPSEVVTLIQQPGMAEALLQLSNLKGNVEKVPGEKKIIVDSNAIQSREQMEALGFKIKELKDKKVEITATTSQAEGALSSFIRSPAQKFVDIIGRIIGGGAVGGVMKAGTNVIPFASGGSFSMRPMPANRAEVVAPKTYRLIGDRARDDEAYIPINRSARSRFILRQTARRMGYALADGGILGKGGSTGSAVTVAEGAIIVNAPFSDPMLVARATLNEIARTVAV